MENPIFRIVKNPIVVSFRKAWKMMLIVFALYGIQGMAYYTARITIWTTLWSTVSKIF